MQTVGESRPKTLEECFPNGIPRNPGARRSKKKGSARNISLQHKDLTSLQIIFFLFYIQRFIQSNMPEFSQYQNKYDNYIWKLVFLVRSNSQLFLLYYRVITIFSNKSEDCFHSFQNKYDNETYINTSTVLYLQVSFVFTVLRLRRQVAAPQG